MSQLATHIGLSHVTALPDGRGWEGVAPAPPFAFATFVAATAALLLRPAELIPGLASLPLYELLLLTSVASSLPQLGAVLASALRGETPAPLCVLGLLVAVVMSHLSRGDLWYARYGGLEFLKVVVYYLLLTAVVDSPGRLRSLLSWLGALVALVAVVALMGFHGIGSLVPSTVLQQQATDPTTGEISFVPRLCGLGIFSDPNDLSLVLLVGMAIALYRAAARGPGRLGWLALVLVLAYALALTRSRGGFVGLVLGSAAVVHARFGLRGLLTYAVLGLPLLFVAFGGGRQTDFALGDGTGQERIRAWSAGLALLNGAALPFGIGKGMYPEAVGIEAHNSFVSSYVELGLFGGTAFFALYYLPIRRLHALRRGGEPTHPELRRLRPFLLAAVVAWAGGMLSLSRAYIVPTYLVVGLADVYLRVVDPGAHTAPVGGGLAVRVALGSGLFLTATYLFIRAFARWS